MTAGFDPALQLFVNSEPVSMVGPHLAAALVAKDLGDYGPDGDRRFDFVITHDRELVVRAAQPLLDRLLPAS
jgi:DICT domain-containing protein